MNSKRLWIGGVILLGLVLVRLWLIWALGHALYAEYPQVDAFTYWQQADGLWQGKDPFKEGLYQPPAYPHFIYAVSHFRWSKSYGHAMGSIWTWLADLYWFVLSRQSIGDALCSTKSVSCWPWLTQVFSYLNKIG